VSATERAARCYALAEAADDVRDKTALRAAAYAWERIARPGVPFSLEPIQRDLDALKLLAAEPLPAPVAPRVEPRVLVFEDKTRAKLDIIFEEIEQGAHSIAF
jgi:hypothetical protein